MKYVHEEFIDNRIEEFGHVRTRGVNKGTAKNSALANRYKKLKHDSYIPMRSAVSAMDFSSNNTSVFERCAELLNKYLADLDAFSVKNKLSINGELKTKFVEEFSCYFLANISEMQNYDVFNEGIFAGLKIKPDYTYEPIKKDVDFCIGRKEVLSIGKNSCDIIIPAISIEFKSYIDSTMLGEVMHTAGKLKGANPRSKAYLVTMVNSFASEHVFEAEYDSSLDEIIVLSPLKRKSENGKTITPIQFYPEGLKEYWNVISEALKVIAVDCAVPEMGRLFAYADGIRNKINEGGK